jgi:hypothetical protein
MSTVFINRCSNALLVFPEEAILPKGGFDMSMAVAFTNVTNPDSPEAKFFLSYIEEVTRRTNIPKSSEVRQELESISSSLGETKVENIDDITQDYFPVKQ